MKRNQLDSATLHPSFLALDRAYLGQVSPDIRAHLGSCEECRRYVEAPGSAATASGLVALQRAIAERREPRAAWLWGGASLAALACCLLLFVARREPSVGQTPPEYLGAKGFRSVWIYVKHGTETQLWDGKRPLSFGDRVRLKVDPGSYHRVEVYSLSDPRNPTLLFGSALAPGQNLTLPDAWEIDDSGAAEQLFVVFSDTQVVPDWDDWRQGKVPSRVAVLPFILPKVGPAGADAGSLSP